MLDLILFFHFIIVSLIIIFILLQKSGEEGALVNKNNPHGGEKVDKVVIIITKYLILAFIINSIAMISVIKKSKTNNTSKIEKLLKEKHLNQNTDE